MVQNTRDQIVGDKRIAQLLKSAELALAAAGGKDHNQVNRKLTSSIEELRKNPEIVVQLYGASQAGKTTFCSLLTWGEEFLPIGRGTATTAVLVELIGIKNAQDQRAEFKWLDPQSLATLVHEPLRPFLPKLKENSAVKTEVNSATKTEVNSATKTEVNSATKTEVNSATKTEVNSAAKTEESSATNSNLSENDQEDTADDESIDENDPNDPLIIEAGNLADEPTRNRYIKALNKAIRRRQQHTQSTGGEHVSHTKYDDLKVAEVILRHFDHYKREYDKDKDGYCTVNLAELSQYTRHPADWSRRASKGFEPAKPQESILVETRNVSPQTERPTLAEYSFDELRCFFVERVRLYTPLHPFAEGIRVVDAPGFGVSGLHDKICRQGQKDADAILLLLGNTGSEIQNFALDEIQQLAWGPKHNLFVLWNPKASDREQSTGVSEKDLNERVSEVSEEYLNEQASGLLQNDLHRMKEGAGVSIPEDRAKVVHLRLALRATQTMRFLSSDNKLNDITMSALLKQAKPRLSQREIEKLHKIFPLPLDSNEQLSARLLWSDMNRDYGGFVSVLDLSDYQTPHALAEASLKESGWNDNVSTLLNAIREVSFSANRRVQMCTSLAYQALENYLNSYPTLKEIEMFEEMKKALSHLITNFGSVADYVWQQICQNIGVTVIGDFDGGDSNAPVTNPNRAANVLYKEFLEFLSDYTKLDELKSSVKSRIEKETEGYRLPSVIKATMQDYAGARCDAWCQEAEILKTPQGEKNILKPYIYATNEFCDWIRKYGDYKSSVSLPPMDVQIPSLLTLNLAEFESESKESLNFVIDKIATPVLFTTVYLWVKDKVIQIGHDIMHEVRKWITIFKGTKTPDKQPVQSFNSKRAYDAASKIIEALFEPQSLNVVLLVDKEFFREPNILDIYLRNLIKTYLMGKSSEQAYQEIEQEELQRLAAHLNDQRGPYLKLMKRVNASLKDNFNSWTQDTKEALKFRLKRLEAQHLTTIEDAEAKHILNILDDLKELLPLETYLEKNKLVRKLLSDRWEQTSIKLIEK